jgi:hypothetical protein
MNSRSEVVLVFARALVFVGMMCVPVGVLAQCPVSGGINGVGPAEDKPFQARETKTNTTYASDGTKHVEVTKSNLFRDRRGRIRIERFSDGSDNPPENVPNDVIIHDNCGTIISLVPAWRIARVHKSPFRATTQPILCREIDKQHPPNAGDKGTFEDLGHKLIEGVEVRGDRTAFYSSVAAKLSGAAPVRMFELWCSMELNTPMGEITLMDNPKSEFTVVISDVRLVDTGPEMFEIPEGYEIVRDEPTPPVGPAKSEPPPSATP